MRKNKHNSNCEKSRHMTLCADERMIFTDLDATRARITNSSLRTTGTLNMDKDTMMSSQDNKIYSGKTVGNLFYLNDCIYEDDVFL